MRMEKNLVLKKKGVTNEKFEVDVSDIDSNGADAGDVLTADGSGGTSWEEIVIPAPIIDVTYAELVALIAAGDLIAGQQYRITDFATTHYIVDGDNTQYTTGDGIVVGVTEPLICLAVGVDEIHAEVKSEMYPEDIIHYDWNPDNWINDLSFGYDDGGGSEIISGFKGVIISRHDTLRQLNAPSDWRNCLTRRWETDAYAWDSGTSYSTGSIVSHAGTSMVYRSVQNANLNNEPTGGDDEYWIVMLDLSTYTYWNANPTSWNGVPSGAGYDDFLLFNDDCRNIDIERITPFYLEEEDEEAVYIPPTLIPNSVFFGIALTSEIGYLFTYNTIGAYFRDNTIGAGFYANTIVAAFYSNTIGAGFKRNTITDSFVMNEVADNVISDINFTGASHVYASYNCYLYKRPDGTAKLRYYDNADAQQIVLPTA